MYLFQDDSKLLDMELNTMVVTALVCHQESLASEADHDNVIVTCSSSSSVTSSSPASASGQKRRRTTSLPDILEEDSIT